MQLAQKSSLGRAVAKAGSTRSVVAPLSLRATGRKAVSPVAPVQHNKTSYVHTERTAVCAAAATEEGTEASYGEQKSNSIFISNLSWGVDSEGLADHLNTTIGGVVRANVMMRDGRSRGMAIADFDSPEAAATAVERLNESEMDGRTLNVRIAEPRPPRTDRAPRQDRYGSDGGMRREPRNDYGQERREREPRREGEQPRSQRDPETLLFVGNLAWATTWQEVRDTFSDNGHPVQFADVKRTPEGRSRGFAIVAMDDAAAAEAATALDQIELGGRRISVRRFNTEPRE